MVWKRRVLGLEEKPFASTGNRRKKEIWVFGLEEKGFGFGRETVCGMGKRMKQEKKNKEDILVLTLFSWFVKLDRCQNFKQGT